MRAEKGRGAPELGKSELSAAGRSLAGQTAAQKARLRDRRARKQGHDTGKRAAGRRQARKPENIHRAGGAGKPRQLPRSKKRSEHRGIKRRRARRSARGASPLLALPGIICRASSAGRPPAPHFPSADAKAPPSPLPPKPRRGSGPAPPPLRPFSLPPASPDPAPHRPRAPAARSRRRGLFFCCGTPSPSRSFFCCTPFFSEPRLRRRGKLPRQGGAGPLPCAARRPLFSPLPFGKAKPAPAFGPSKAPTTPPRCKKPLEIPFLSHRALGVFCFAAQKKGGPGAHGAHRGPPSRRPVSSSLFQRGERQGGGFSPAQPFRLPQRPLIFEKPEFPGGLAGDAAQAAGHPAAEIE